MCDRFGWNMTMYNAIDWDTHGANLTWLQFYTHRFVVKHIQKKLPVQGISFNPYPSDACPYCGKPETVHYFQTCPFNPEPWSSISTELLALFQKYDIDLVLCIIIHLSLEEIPLMATLQRQHPSIHFFPYKHLCYGYWAKLWQPLEWQYATKMNTKYNTVWVGQAIQLMRNHAHPRWKV
eukprot:15366041-Ditylum_brightwellii.AAC.2